MEKNHEQNVCYRWCIMVVASRSHHDKVQAESVSLDLDPQETVHQDTPPQKMTIAFVFIFIWHMQKQTIKAI